MRLIIFAFTICSLAFADSKADRESVAELNRRNAELIQQIRNAMTDQQAELVKLRSQVAARSKDAAALAASGRSEAKTVAVGQSDAIAVVQQSTDAIQLQIAQIPLQIAQLQLKAASPWNSVAVWLAVIAILGNLGFALVGHSKLNTVAEHVNGLNEKMGAAREEKGREEGRKEGRQR